jgi:hypothetical protein
MIEIQNIEHEAEHSLDRMLPHVEGILGSQIKKADPGWQKLVSWLQRIFTGRLMRTLHAALLQQSKKDHDHEE